MTQSEVYNLLKKTKEWMTVKEIARELNIGDSAVSMNLRKLFKYGEINVKETKAKGKPRIWRAKDETS